MLLGRVLGELSHPISSNCFNIAGHDDDSMAADRAGCSTSSPELNLHLEFFNRRKELLLPEHPENAEPSSVSIPFQWEEKPGKAKNYPQKSPVAALTLPPVRKSRHVSKHSLDSVNLVANSPRTLSSRLRSILQPKFSHNLRVDAGRDEFGGESDKVALNVGVHYPEEFQWRSLRNSSPVSIFEGPDDSSSSSSSMSLLSYCNNNNNSNSNKQLALSCSSAKQNSVPALLANRLIPVTDMLNAVPVEAGDGGLIRVHREVGRIKDVKSLVGFDSLNTLRKRSRNYKSSRSLSFGGADIDFSCEEQPNRMLTQEAKLDKYHAIVGHKLDSYSLSAAPVALTTFSSGVAASEPYLSKNSSIESVKLGFPHTLILSHSNNSQNYPRSKNLDKVKRDFRDSYVEVDHGQSKLIDNHGNKFQDVKEVLPKRRIMQQRMNMGGCCSPKASQTINCCSSKSATKTTNPSLNTEKKASLPKHRKHQMEWRNLYGKDEIQK